jgi:thiamine kinase-like enzyme
MDSGAARLRSTTPANPETALGLRLIEGWLGSSDAITAQREDRRVFSRVDTSLANALWDGAGVRFVDLEYAGWLAPCLDLAEQVEHVQSRGTADDTWLEIVNCVDPELPEELRVAGQRLLVLEWLVRFWPADGKSSQDFLTYLRRAENLCREDL